MIFISEVAQAETPQDYQNMQTLSKTESGKCGDINSDELDDEFRDGEFI